MSRGDERYLLLKGAEASSDIDVLVTHPTATKLPSFLQKIVVIQKRLQNGEQTVAKHGYSHGDTCPDLGRHRGMDSCTKYFPKTGLMGKFTNLINFTNLRNLVSAATR